MVGIPRTSSPSERTGKKKMQAAVFCVWPMSDLIACGRRRRREGSHRDAQGTCPKILSSLGRPLRTGLVLKPLRMMRLFPSPRTVREHCACPSSPGAWKKLLLSQSRRAQSASPHDYVARDGRSPLHDSAPGQTVQIRESRSGRSDPGTVASLHERALSCSPRTWGREKRHFCPGSSLNSPERESLRNWLPKLFQSDEFE